VTSLAKLLEAALFASARPIPLEELAALDPEASPAALSAALDEVREHYDTEGHGVELVEIGEGWQILTRAEYTEAIERAQLAARPQRLSAAALESLAIIAYRQPIGRAEIEEIRGVAVGGMLRTLLERGGERRFARVGIERRQLFGRNRSCAREERGLKQLR
jgi:segregation and condensation protein B